MRNTYIQCKYVDWLRQSLLATVMAVNLQRGGERAGERRQKQSQLSAFKHRLAYCKAVCSIGLSSNGLSLYINATPVNLGYSKFTEHSRFVTTTQNENVLPIFALVCVTTAKRNMSVTLDLWGKNSERDKTVVCTFWCEVSVYYMCKHLYFSCENVGIYENVNIRSMEPVSWQ